MSSLPPIPTPPAQKWREFRVRVAPILVFVLTGLGVVISWHSYVLTPTATGEVESVRANLITTKAGLLTELAVERFQVVKKDQVLGKVAPMEPELLKASLTVMEMDLRVMRARLALSERQNELNQAQLKLDWLSQRVQLAGSRAAWQQAQTELARVRQMHAEKVVSDFDLEVAVRDDKRLQAEVDEKERLVAQVGDYLEAFGPFPAQEGGGADSKIIEDDIQAQEAKLLLLEGPITLRAPRDGMVSVINRHAGERIMAGDPILVVSAMRTDHIIGYLRQPLTVFPRPGDQVTVRTRGAPRRSVVATIMEVGTQLENVTTPMRMRGFENAQERGLPFLVNLPEGFEVLPGELVDLAFASRRR